MKQKSIAALGFALLVLEIGSIGPVWADPPPWAPAHGYRAKHQYIYYPQHRIYYEPERRTWFWFDSGRWRVGASLPADYARLAVGGVAIDLDSDRPYEQQTWVEEHYGRPDDNNHRGHKHSRHGGS